jgi:hypothetical protein
MIDIGTFFDESGMLLFFKIVILFCIGLFTVFTVFLLNYINSLKRIIIIKDVTGSTFIYLLAVLYVIASASLFIFALVIL